VAEASTAALTCILVNDLIGVVWRRIIWRRIVYRCIVWRGGRPNICKRD